MAWFESTLLKKAMQMRCLPRPKKELKSPMKFESIYIRNEFYLNSYFLVEGILKRSE